METLHRPIPIVMIIVVLIIVIFGNSTAWAPVNSQQVVSQTTTVTLTSISQTTVQPTVVTTKTETIMRSYLPQGTMEASAFFFLAAFLVTTLLLAKTRRPRPPRKQFCISCGAELKLGSQFCGKCGAKQLQN